MPNVYEVVGRTMDNEDDRYIVLANDIEDIPPLFGPELKIHYIQMINQPEDKVVIQPQP